MQYSSSIAGPEGHGAGSDDERGSLIDPVSILSIGVVTDGDQDDAGIIRDELQYRLGGILTGQGLIVTVLSPYQAEQGVARQEHDFLLAMPEQALRLERQYGAMRLAVMRRLDRTSGRITSLCGTAVFVRADRSEIQSLPDLRNKSLMGMDPRSFCGCRIACHALSRHGIAVERDLSSTDFRDVAPVEVIEAVLAGQVDAGTVPALSLMRLHRSGMYRAEELRVLNAGPPDPVPFPYTDTLYPGWTMTSTGKAAASVVTDMVQALAGMPCREDTEGKTIVCGWDFSPDYRPVYELLAEPACVREQETEPDSAHARSPEYWRPLLRVVTHEVRTPLNVILGLADLMRDYSQEEIPEEVEVCLDDIHLSAERLGQLISTLADFALSQFDLEPEGYEQVAMDTLIGELEEVFTRAVRGPAVHIQQDVPLAWKTFRVRGLRLYPLVSNLVSQCHKFSGRVPLDIDFRADEGLFHMRIRWTGKETVDVRIPVMDWTPADGLNGLIPSAQSFVTWMYIFRTLIRARSGSLDCMLSRTDNQVDLKFPIGKTDGSC